MINPDDLLEAAADRLLEVHGFIQRGQGKKNIAEFYTESQIDDRCRRDLHRPVDMLREVICRDFADMVESEMIEVAMLARHTDVQMDIWRLHVYGVSNADIARTLYADRVVDDCYICRTLAKCRRKIARAAWMNPFHG
jgi:hypothetical protein